MPERMVLFNKNRKVGEGVGIRKKRDYKKNRMLPAAWI